MNRKLTRTKTSFQRVTHAYWVREALGRGVNSEEAKTEQAIVRQYLEYVASLLMEGYRVELFGIGTIHMGFRAARKAVGYARKDHPAQYMLKISPNQSLRHHLKELAVKYPDPATLPGNQGNRQLWRKGRKRTERPASDLIPCRRSTRSHPPASRDQPHEANTETRETTTSAASNTHSPIEHPAKDDKPACSGRTTDTSSNHGS